MIERTYAIEQERGYSWSHQGEFTIWAAYLNAIKQVTGSLAFAMRREDVADSLTGGAISISLVPPLCVVGVGNSHPFAQRL